MSNQTPRYVKCCKVHPSNWDYDRVFRLLIVSPKSQDHGYWNLAGLSLAKWKLTALSIVFSHRTLEYIQSHMIQSSSLIKCKRSTLRSKLSIVRCFFLLWCDWWFSIVIFFAIIIIHNRLLSVDNSTQCLHKHNITSLIGIRILWMSQTTNFLCFFCETTDKWLSLHNCVREIFQYISAFNDQNSWNPLACIEFYMTHFVRCFLRCHTCFLSVISNSFQFFCISICEFVWKNSNRFFFRCRHNCLRQLNSKHT